MSDVVIPFEEVNNGLADALQERGVVFPVGGFAPGLYLQTCLTCRRRHMAAKHGTACLPCAMTLCVGIAVKKTDTKTTSYEAGRRDALDDMARFIGSGARLWSPYRTTPPDAAEKSGQEQVDDLIERTRSARERIQTELRAAEQSNDEDQGGDGA